MRKMPCAINWTSRAKLRLRVRQDWIEEESASHEIALAWTARINEEVLAIADFPKQGRIVPEFDREDIREIIVHGTTRVIYKIHGNSCYILSVRRTREQITSIRSL